MGSAKWLLPKKLGIYKKLGEGKKVFSIDILYYVRIVILYKTF
jgi:hypothetical protein